MEVRILGPLEVSAAGRQLPLGGTQQRAVMAMLVLSVNQLVSVDRLVDGLWGSAPPDSAVNAVQVYVSRLRKTLTEDLPGGRAPVLHRRRPGYLLELDAEQVDLYRFQRLARQGTQTLTRAPGRAADLMREALGLWRGPPLAEFTHLPFAQTEIPRLAEQRLTAVQTRVQADLALGRHAELVGELEALVAEHPLREELHHQLIVSLYRCGRQGEALEAHRRVRRLLADDLGVDPGRALQQLEAGILAHDPQLDWTPPPGQPTPTTPAFASTGAGLPAVWNVPARNPHFVGRAEMLTELRQRLGSGEQMLVVQALHGLGGVGKTQLAIEYAHRFAADYQLVCWIDAEQPALLATQVAALAGSLGLPTGQPVAEAVGLVLAELTRRPDWLLIFDNAQRPQDLAAYQPGGSGHVLVTSRQLGWGALGGRLEVDVLTRSETIALLRRRLPELDERLADQLADQLGDLPLAAAQAAGYLEQTGLPPADYLRRFRTRQASLLAKGEVIGYQGRLDTTWALSLERLVQDTPAAAQLLQLAAFLAPEPIPLYWFTDHAELLAEPLHTAAAVADCLDDTVGMIVGYSLARRHADRIQLHRLVQAAIRHRLPPAQQQSNAEEVLTLLAATHPGDPDDPAAWNSYAELVPHVLATSAQGDNHPAYQQLILDTIRYLHAKGDSQASRVVSEQLLDRWRRTLGADDPATLRSATTLTLTLGRLGEAESARTLGEDTVARCRQALGPNHSTTLFSATALTFALVRLGEAESARTLGEDTVTRCRQALGPNHPVTLLAAAALSSALIQLGEAESARTLSEDTVTRCRQALGPDHSTTLFSTAILMDFLVGMREAESARTLGEDTVARCQQALGPNHPVTLLAAAALTSALAQLGEAESARTLGEDTVARCRQALDSNHPITLFAAASLTPALAKLGEAEPACPLDEETIAFSQRALGPDHLATLFLAQVAGVGYSPTLADDPGADL